MYCFILLGRLCHVHCALRDDGTFWLNLGDSYEKGELCGIPWNVAFDLSEEDWRLVGDVIWHKTNPMPGSYKNRPVSSHEYIFLLAKQKKHFYDEFAIREQSASDPNGTRTKRDVWTFATAGYKGAHFSVFPEALPTPCILAGTSEQGCCPECGAQWTRIVKRNRQATRPGKNSKIYVPDVSKKQDAVGKQTYTGFNQRWKDHKEIGNRDPERHVTDIEHVGWEPGCKCHGEMSPDFIGDDPKAMKVGTASSLPP
ncbi:unnamed protein product, partial [marine sediment metagenome]